MKSKITLFLMLLMLSVLSFTGNVAFAQTVTGKPTSDGCPSHGIITVSSTGLGAAPEYQLLTKSGNVVAPTSGNSSDFTKVAEFGNLDKGEYVIKARSGSGAQSYSSAVITVTDGYTDMTVSGQAPMANCVGGTSVITASVTGGKGPFIYMIALQSDQKKILQTSAPTNATTFAFDPLNIGSYLITVTNGCTITSTGTAPILNPTLSIDQVKAYLTPYPTKAGVNCKNPIRLKIEGGFRYVSSNQSLSAADAALFTWKIKYKGKYYGQGATINDYAVLDGPGFPLSNANPIMPQIADRAGVLANMADMKVVLMNSCGDEREFAVHDYNKDISYLSLGNCGGSAILKSSIAEGLDCLPITLKFTNQANSKDSQEFKVEYSAQTFTTTALTPGAYYNVTYVDSEGYTKDLYTAASNVLLFNAVSYYAVNQNFSPGYTVSLNDLEYGYLQLKVDPVESTDTLKYTVIASDNPKVPVNYSYEALISTFQNGSTGYPLLPSPNKSDPSPYWPKGNYTLKVESPCGSSNVDVIVQGRTANLNDSTITPICAGFNYVMNGTFDDYRFYQVVIIKAPNSDLVNQTVDLANATSSKPFEGLPYGDYTFALRIKGGTKNLFEVPISYTLTDVIKVDRSKTGGYVCNENSKDGVLTIIAQSKVAAPNNTLTYALQASDGSYGNYQTSNEFTGLGSGIYTFQVKDGCGNGVPQTAKIAIASAPVIDVNGLISDVKFCPNTSGTIQLDVDILNAASYTWTGPGITATNKSLKSPSIKYSDLLVGANNYTCTVKMGAPCNTENQASLIITGLPLPIISVNDPLPVCFPGTVDLTAPSVTSGNATGLTYYTDSAATTALVNPKAVSASGTYFIKATNGQCDSILPVVVTINPLPIATITYSNGTYCNRGTADVTRTGLNGGTYSSDTGLVINPATGQINLTKSTAGDHTVTYTFNNGTCSNTTTAIVTLNATTLPVAPLDITGKCSVAKPVAPTLVDPCAGGLTATTNTSFPITKLGESDITWVFDYGNGFTQSVIQKVIISETTLSGAVSTSCASDGSGYMVTLNVNGEGPYTVTGTGAPGTWAGSVWTSGTIPAGTNYNVNIQDKYKCNTLPVSGTAPICCLFDVVCPTFPEATITCYDQLPTAVSLTKAQFEALGNGDGAIGKTPCGVIEITASNSADPGCDGNVTRTYTVTEYADPNNNKVHDLGENTVLNTTTCTQVFTIKKADFIMPADAGTIVTCASEATVAPTVPEIKDSCGNVLMPSAPVISPSPKCNGDVTYTYAFTDCAGITHNWVYTYTIETVDFVMPANEQSTVTCFSSIVAPTVPEIKDNCGNVLTAGTPVISPIPGCNGDVTYTYAFTDCAGNTHNWIYTYTIETVDFVMPANEQSTVTCSSSIVAPTVPEIKDNCGNVLTAGTPVISPIPGCNGDVTYTYAFTDCTGNTHNWVYTYTIETVDFVMPANEQSTVTCSSSIVAPTVPEIKDNCGNVLTAGTPVISPIPGCNGDVTYTYAFTDCTGNTHNWVYTYTIKTVDFVMPANTGTTVTCVSAAAIAPTVPLVTDNCGNVLVASLPVVSPLPACNGNVDYTYTFTDCAGNMHDWVYTYTIDNTIAPTGKAPADLVLQCIDDIPVANTNAVTNTIANCKGAIVITVEDTNNEGKGCKGDPYIVTRTFTLTDCGGLVTNLVQKITVEDTTAPVFVETLPANMLVDCADEIPVAVILTAIDNCSTANVAYDEVRVNGNCSGNYQLQRTWTATDSCGNENSHTQLITVADNKAPNFVESLPEAVVNATCETIPSAATLTASDTCGIATVDYTETKVDGDCSSKYDLVRLWVASDDCGNQNRFTQTIHVSCLPEIYNAISPNGDGLNDTFTIGGIDCYPNNNLKIYNRYGVLVYEKQGYDNVTNPFEGFSDGRATLKRGDKLPTGTYFYTLEYNDDNKNRVEKAGYLYINNN